MKQHIRLNMIVKNESHVIIRCLASVMPYIDSWCIVDTGSTDGTQEIIQDYLKGIPGELYERPWQNFGYNRTEALQLATSEYLPLADYLLFIDADEQLQIQSNLVFSALTETAYYFWVHYGNLRYKRNALVSTRLSWQWKGVLHEYLDSTEKHQWHTLDQAIIFVQHDGARAQDTTTYLKDIALLEQGLVDEPDNSRYVFYLAQSYRDAKILDKSREFFLKRAQLGGWEEERWMAQFRAAQMAERLDLEEVVVYREYLQSWIVNQKRAEPLYELARYYRGKNNYNLAGYFAEQAVKIAVPEQGLFIDYSVYEWRALDELAVAGTWCKTYEEVGKEAMQKLLIEEKYPLSQKQRMLDNSKLYH